MAANTSKTQTAQTAQTPSMEDLLAELARVREELAQAQAKAQRSPRERRITPKQQRLVNYLHDNPDANIADACEAVGATRTSHGLIFRMIEDGYLQVSPAAPKAEVKEESQEAGAAAPTEAA